MFNRERMTNDPLATNPSKNRGISFKTSCPNTMHRQRCGNAALAKPDISCGLNASRPQASSKLVKRPHHRHLATLQTRCPLGRLVDKTGRLHNELFLANEVPSKPFFHVHERTKHLSAMPVHDECLNSAIQTLHKWKQLIPAILWGHVV